MWNPRRDSRAERAARRGSSAPFVTAFLILALSSSLGAQQSATKGSPPKHAAPGDSTVAWMTRALRLQGRVVLSDIRFSGVPDTLTADSEGTLRELARALLFLPGVYLIEAHCHSSGDMAADLMRTDRRAAAVRTRLGTLGVSPARLLIMGYGGTKRPAASLPNASGEERIEISRVP